MCRMWWPLTLTYIFKVIWPWLRKSCPLCSVYSFGWNLFILSTNDHYHYRVCRVLRFFFRIWKCEFLPNLKKKIGLDLGKKFTDPDGFFPYIAQMITSMRGCVAYNDPWPWPIYFKVHRPWLWKSCLLCNVFSSRSIISIFATNIY